MVAADVMIGGEDAAVVTDNRLAGKQIGEYAAKRLNGKGNVLILDMPGNPEAEKRTDGFREVIKGYPGLLSLIFKNSNGDMNTAMNIMENWLQKYKKVDLVDGVNDPTSLGALSAINPQIGRRKCSSCPWMAMKKAFRPSGKTGLFQRSPSSSRTSLVKSVPRR